MEDSALLMLHRDDFRRRVEASPSVAWALLQELSLIDDGPRSAHVIAMEDSALLMLHRDDFRRRVEASPS